MKLLKLIGIALVGLYLQTAYASTGTPESVVKTVADWYMKDGAAGLPDPRKEPIKTGFSDRLKRLITQAQIEQDKQQKSHPDEKPVFIEMPLINGIPDAVSGYRIVEARKTGLSVRVTLAWNLVGETGTVKSQMLVAREHGRWVVVDILHGDSGQSVAKALQNFR